MLRFIPFPVLVLITISFPLTAATIYDEISGKLQLLYGTAAVSKRIKYTIPSHVMRMIGNKAGEPFSRGYVSLWKINSDKMKNGLALLDTAEARSATAIFLVTFSGKGQIKSVQVIRYYGSEGRGIQRKKWLEQFRNRKSTFLPIPGKNVDVVSGATSSSHALIRGIRRLTLLNQYISKMNVY